MDKDELGLSLNTNVNIETEPEYIEMDKLALSAPLEFLSKYNSPKEWILEQEEAERSRVWNGPAQVGPFEKAQYGVGQAIYEFERAPSEFLQVGAGLYKGLYDLFFPNSTETALDRFYNSLALSNLENRERREDLVKAYTGEDSDIVDWSSAIAQLGLIMASAGIGAGIGAQAARQGINKLATETAKGVATRPAVIRRATQIAARKGAQTGGIATTIGTMFPQEAGSSALESVRQYIAQTGDTNLKNYKPGADSLTALAVGTINSAIEVGFGVERYIPEFWGTNTNFNRAARRFVEGTLGEGAEEFTQSLVSQIGEIVNGYRDDIDWNEAWHNALIGGVLGGAAGSGMYYLNRRRMARQVANDYNMPYKKAAALVDEMLGTGIESTTNELSARSELLNAHGNAWDKMVTGVKTAMASVDFGDEQARNNQASQFAKTNVAIAIREAQKAGLSTDEFLDVAEFETVNNGQNLNMVFLKPLGSVQDIDKRIEAQDAIINRQKELKKTGAADNDALNLARQRKAILQKAKAIKQYNDAQYKAQIKAQTTPETAQEIETATNDVESVKGATQAEFDSKVDTENLTSAEKSKRYGNAVLKRLLPSKSDFDAVMVDPMYANAKQAMIAVADRINSFIKAHRTYGLKTDITNALKKMQTVNQGNFIDSVTTPDLDGVDVIAENAFLYHFLFSDATTIQTYLDSYITRAEDSLNQKKGNLSKKDLVGQSFKATDNAMQTQAQVIGAEYTSIYNEDGSYADKNVMAVMLSYQNQFVSDAAEETTVQEPTAEEQKEAVEQAADVADGTITTGTPEPVAENVIQDYGEKIEGAKKDLVGKGVSAETLTDIDKIMKKAPKSETSKQILRNWLEQQDPAFVAQIRQLNLPIRVSKTLEYRRVLEEAFTQHPELNQEADRYSVLAGNEELSKETLDKYGIIPEYDFYYKTTDDRYVKLTPENVSARIEGRGALQFSYSKSTRGTYFLWAKKGSGSWIPLIEFNSMEEMDEHRNSNTQEDREKIYQEMTSFKDNRKEKVIRERVGTDYRNGKNITEEQFAKQFGFRGVQFGNYENQEKRQREINNSYDSFMDLAKILNLPPKAISLGGTLGIAFGARGSGSALAHYEPDLKVINITRDAGAGALAHEWFHALDNYLAQNLSQYANMAGGGFLTKADNYYYYRINEELADSMKEYIKAIKSERNFQLRLRQLGQYWKRDWEVAARLFEQYVSSKVAEQNGINDYLASPQKYYISSSPYLKLDEAERVFPKLENMLKSIKTREEDDNVILYQRDLLNVPETDSDGKIIQNPEAFWSWFGYSKVTNSEGEPLVVYTGSKDTDFRIFDLAQMGQNGSSEGMGFYFTPDKDVASGYGKTRAFYLSLQNPVYAYSGVLLEKDGDYVTEDEYTEVLQEKIRSVISKLEEKGYSFHEDMESGLLSALWSQTYPQAQELFDGLLDTRFYLTDLDADIATFYQAVREATIEEFGVDGYYTKKYGNSDVPVYVAWLPNQIKSTDNVAFTRSPDVYAQGKKANGFYDPELGVIVLGRNMNEMTLPHEMQHYWLDKIFSIYKRAKSGELQVRDEWLTETKALFDMLGIDENQTQLTEGQQEKFARMSEAYLTGIGVTGDMNATFKEYQQWVPEKYKSILNLGYLSDDGKIEYPFLDQGAVDFFNKWYANYSLPSLATSPERQEFINPEDQNGEVLPVSIKEMNNRDKEFGNDAEEQVKTDQRLYNTLDENMPAEIKIEADGQKVVQASRSNFLKESEKQQRRWFERKSRDTEAQLAQDYIEKNQEHAKEVVYGDPELIPNDTGIDRATLINAYMALNNITPESEDWATLQTNIAINQSLAGTQLALSNNTSYRTYLDALREIENAREMKAATNYAGAKQGAVERFNRDIQRFVDEELPKVLATAPNTEARDIALKSLFERARTKFSGNTTGGVLNQMDFDYARGQKGASAAFTRWAVNQIKKDAGAKLNGQEQAHLLNLSAKAQQAVIDLDDRDIGKAVAGAQEIRKWQVEKDKLMGVKPKGFNLFGDYAPRAMLASFNTLVVSNIPSTAINTGVVRILESGIFGKNEVSESLTDSEIKRIKAIYGATAMNLAQMERPTSPSLLHGEKYSSSGQKWYDPFTILGKEDNWFRVPTFVDTLARIATQDAKATGKNADDVFKEYCRLENQSDEAKLARKQALAVSNMAVFTQDGALARSLNGIRDWINQGSRALIGLDPKGFGLGNLLSPFLKTGANIAEMGIRGSLAPITTISALAQKWRSGKAIDPMKKLALAMDWTYFLLSSVMVSLLAALTSDDDEFYTEPYEMGKTYDPDKPYDSINIAGVWIDLDFFGPFAIPIRTGCRLVKQWKTDNLSAIYEGYGQGLKYAAMDTPLLQEIFNNQMSYAAKKPEDWATGLAYNQANKLIPSQVKPLSRAISRGTGAQFDTGLGKVIERKFHRNYGFDGAELTTQDLIDIFSTKFTYQP